MKKYYLLIVFNFLIALLASGKINQRFTGFKTSLSGKVIDKVTGELLPGVTLYIPDLKSGAISTIDGTYKIDNLLKTKILI